MKKEDRDLLFRDMCSRLPYGVKCLVNYTICNETTDYNDVPSSTVDTITTINRQTESYFFEWLSEWFDCDEFKPYLFPLSSMTEEQRLEYYNTLSLSGDISSSVDFYNKYHFDYRGLIPMGLAIDATGIGIYENR